MSQPNSTLPCPQTELIGLILFWPDEKSDGWLVFKVDLPDSCFSNLSIQPRKVNLMYPGFTFSTLAV